MSLLLRKNLSPFRLVSFDVTDTLITLRHSPGTIYERVAREEAGHTGLDIKHLDKQFKANFKALAKEYPNYGKATTGWHWQTWWTVLVQRTFKDVVTDPIQLQSISEKLINFYATADCWVAMPGAVDLVQQIKDSGLRTCIITNSDPRTETILKNLGFPHFDSVHSAYDSGFVKPDPSIFQMALPIDMKPQEAMHIGNDLELDYCAANTAKWTGVLIHAGLPKEEPEKYKFKYLASFIEHLERK